MGGEASFAGMCVGANDSVKNELTLQASDKTRMMRVQETRVLTLPFCDHRLIRVMWPLWSWLKERRTACTAAPRAGRGAVEQESASRGGGRAGTALWCSNSVNHSGTCVLCEEHFHAPQLCTAHDCRRWRCLTRLHGERDKGPGRGVPQEDRATSQVKGRRWAVCLFVYSEIADSVS
jgi:hypothetical protein